MIEMSIFMQKTFLIHFTHTVLLISSMLGQCMKETYTVTQKQASFVSLSNLSMCGREKI